MKTAALTEFLLEYCADLVSIPDDRMSVLVPLPTSSQSINRPIDPSAQADAVSFVGLKSPTQCSSVQSQISAFHRIIYKQRYAISNCS